MKKNRNPNDLSVEELERLLAAKRRVQRQERIRRFGRSGRAMFSEPPPVLDTLAPAAEEPAPAPPRSRWIDGLLLAVEIAGVVGFGWVLLQGFFVLRDLNREAVSSLLAGTPSATPLINAAVLPSGHVPPNAAGLSAPNEEEIPANLRPLMQSYLSLPIPTRGPEQAVRLDLASIGMTNLPVVEGDGWEQLKQGVGHHIGSANPGTNGNVVLSAHDDIYGELFRELDRLQPGDEAILYTVSRRFVYIVINVQVVDPTDVDVMASTGRPTLTLITCYPYMVDTQRVVVTAELSPE